MSQQHGGPEDEPIENKKPDLDPDVIRKNAKNKEGKPDNQPTGTQNKQPEKEPDIEPEPQNKTQQKPESPNPNKDSKQPGPKPKDKDNPENLGKPDKNQENKEYKSVLDRPEEERIKLGNELTDSMKYKDEYNFKVDESLDNHDKLLQSLKDYFEMKMLNIKQINLNVPGANTQQLSDDETKFQLLLGKDMYEHVQDTVANLANKL